MFLGISGGYKIYNSVSQLVHISIIFIRYSMVNVYFLLAVTPIIASLPAIFVKHYGQTNCIHYIILAAIAETLLLICYYLLFSVCDLGTSYALISLVKVAIVSLMGICYFGESCNKTQAMGLVSALVAVCLLTPQ